MISAVKPSVSRIGRIFGAAGALGVVDGHVLDAVAVGEARERDRGGEAGETLRQDRAVLEDESRRKARRPLLRSGMSVPARKLAEVLFRNHFAGLRTSGMLTSAPVREPTAISAPSSIWSSRSRILSSGYVPSASVMTTTSVCACVKPVLSAAPSPWFLRCVTTRRLGMRAAQRASTSAVRSFEPSLTAITKIGTPMSSFDGDPSRPRRRSPRCRRARRS